ncbi:unnamed protein product [Closterium sp. Yama58-4]|nr:unnamed protein product [Closterium sp. Yama58-4]
MTAASPPALGQFRPPPLPSTLAHRPPLPPSSPSSPPPLPPSSPSSPPPLPPSSPSSPPPLLPSSPSSPPPLPPSSPSSPPPLPPSSPSSPPPLPPSSPSSPPPLPPSSPSTPPPLPPSSPSSPPPLPPSSPSTPPFNPSSLPLLPRCPHLRPLTPNFPHLIQSLSAILPSSAYSHSPPTPENHARQNPLLRLTLPPTRGRSAPIFPPPAVPGAPMFPMGGAGGGDSGEAEEGRRKERERREELIAAVREGRGSWQEVAAAVRQLQQAGMTAEEVADVAMLAHGRLTELVVAAQVYESLLPGPLDPEGDGADSGFDVVAAFQSEQTAELLYELRTLPTAGRRQAAAYVVQQGLDASRVRELVRAMRDHARRPNSREGFSSAPGDCLAFMCFRAAGESSGEERRAWVERGMAAAVTESARARLQELQ